MNPKLMTVTISRDTARDIAKEEAADMYNALFSDYLELRQDLERMRREHESFRRTVLLELNRLRDAAG